MISDDFSVDICIVAYSKQHHSVSRCCSFPRTFIHLSFFLVFKLPLQAIYSSSRAALCITCNSRILSVFVGVDTAWSATVVEEAESLGLVVACITGICIVSAKPLFIARGWLGAKDGLDVLAQGSGQAEVFERVTTSRNNSTSLPPVLLVILRQYSQHLFPLKLLFCVVFFSRSRLKPRITIITYCCCFTLTVCGARPCEAQDIPPSIPITSFFSVDLLTSSTISCAPFTRNATPLRHRPLDFHARPARRQSIHPALQRQ